MEHTLNVQGMTCGHCERAVTKAVQNIDPQAKVNIDRSQNQVRIESSQARDVLATVITEEGYSVAA